MSNSAKFITTKRSDGSLTERRRPLAWPRDRDFRILSLDGGGIKGIFPAAVLAGIEKRLLGGQSIAQYFDLIAGTSTGGIIALGLSAGLTAGAILDLYIKHGGTIFPAYGGHFFGGLMRSLRRMRQLGAYVYERGPLEILLEEALGDRLLGDAICRLNIPAFEGRHSEVYVYKTPHHQDFSLDAKEKMVNAAFATAAAPTFFRAFPRGEFVMVDGGVWANNPTMIAVVDALTCFDLSRHRVSVLSVGCSSEPFTISSQLAIGGLWHWRKIIGAAMHLQSQNALGQARLLIGAERLVRLEPPAFSPSIEMDDYLRAKALLLPAAAAIVEECAKDITGRFLFDVAEPYKPIVGGV